MVTVDAEDFCLEYVDALGRVRRGPLEVMWSARFENGGPVRGFPSFKGQRNFTGRYWAATGTTHVGYESWLERDHAMHLDFDRRVTEVVSQPFRLSWRPVSSRGRVRHTPDYFVRHHDGSVLVVDVRPDERIEPDDAAKFTATAVACGRIGWGYQRLGVLDPVLSANLRWLAGYRHPRVMCEPVAAALRVVFAEARGLLHGVREVGDPIGVLPVLFHLLWRQDLVVDVRAELLSAATLVGPASETVGAEVGCGGVTSTLVVGG